MTFRTFDLLDTLFGSLLGALFVLGMLSITTVILAAPEAGPALAGPVLPIPSLAGMSAGHAA